MTLEVSASPIRTEMQEHQPVRQCLGHKELIKVSTNREKIRTASDWALNNYQKKEHIQPGFFTEMEISEGIENADSKIYVLFMVYSHVDNCESCTNFKLV